MSMQVDNYNQIDVNKFIEQISAEIARLGMYQSSDAKDAVPNVSTGFDATDLPSLPAPAGPLSLDVLLFAIGHENRKLACKQGIDTLELKGQQQAEINEKEQAELKEQIEKMAQKKVADTFLSIFNIIGAVLGALASVSSIVLGVLTANPLLVAGGALGLVMCVDSVVNMATGGEHCISAWVAKGCESLGMDSEAAQWVGMGVSLALTIAAACMSVGGAVQAKSAMPKVASQIVGIINKTTLITNIANGTNNIAKGGTMIASGVYSYQISMSQADIKELEAILENIRMAQQREQDMIENEMERANALIEDVSDIVKSCNETHRKVQTMNPTMA